MLSPNLVFSCLVFIFFCLIEILFCSCRLFCPYCAFFTHKCNFSYNWMQLRECRTNFLLEISLGRDAEVQISLVLSSFVFLVFCLVLSCLVLSYLVLFYLVSFSGSNKVLCCLFWLWYWFSILPFPWLWSLPWPFILNSLVFMLTPFSLLVVGVLSFSCI